MTTLKKRIAPSVPVSLELSDGEGTNVSLGLRLSYDFNAVTRIEEKTGLNLLNLASWNNLNATALGVMFWAGLIARQPEYAGDEGLEVARSYIDLGNQAYIQEQIVNAWTACIPKKDPNPQPEQAQPMQAPGNGIGNSIGQ